MYWNLWDTATGVPRRKSIALNAYTRKEEKSRIKYQVSKLLPQEARKRRVK